VRITPGGAERGNPFFVGTGGFFHGSIGPSLGDVLCAGILLLLWMLSLRGSFL